MLCKYITVHIDIDIIIVATIPLLTNLRPYGIIFMSVRVGVWFALINGQFDCGLINSNNFQFQYFTSLLSPHS